MNARYIVWQGRTPRVDLTGSPFPSRRQAMKATRRAAITLTRITSVRRKR